MGTAKERLMDRFDNADVVVSEAGARVTDGTRVVSDAIQKGRVAVSQSSEPLLAFARENPLKALMIAMVSGTFFWAFAKALAASRA
jgi:hypothetical protein